MSILGTIALAAIPAVGIPGLALRFLAPVVFKRIAGGAVEKAKGIPPKGWIAIGLVVALVVGIFVARAWLHHHDKAEDRRYEAGVQNEVRAEVNTATVRADAAQNVQAAVDAERQAEVVAGINNAVAAHPVEAKRATGPASQAALDRLRRK